MLKGNRATVPARIGQSLLDAALSHKIDIEGPCRGGGASVETRRSPTWNEYTYGEGPNCFYCHVQIPSSFNHLLDPPGDSEKKGLSDFWVNDYLRTSRLACAIQLEKKHDGLVVFVPDAPPVDVM